MERYWQGKTKVLGKTCLGATLSTANHTWDSLGSNPGLRSERVVTIYMRHGSAHVITETRLFVIVESLWTTTCSLQPLLKCVCYIFTVFLVFFIFLTFYGSQKTQSVVAESEIHFIDAGNYTNYFSFIHLVWFDSGHPDVLEEIRQQIEGTSNTSMFLYYIWLATYFDPCRIIIRPSSWIKPLKHCINIWDPINVHYIDWCNVLDTLQIWQWTLTFIILIDATILTRYEFDSGH